MIEPMQAPLRPTMNQLAKELAALFPDCAFVLLVTPFNDTAADARVNYISNAQRADIIVLLKQFLALTQGQPMVAGHG